MEVATEAKPTALALVELLEDGLHELRTALECDPVTNEEINAVIVAWYLLEQMPARIRERLEWFEAQEGRTG
jgi:hypothetical protein